MNLNPIWRICLSIAKLRITRALILITKWIFKTLFSNEKIG